MNPSKNLSGPLVSAPPSVVTLENDGDPPDPGQSTGALPVVRSRKRPGHLVRFPVQRAGICSPAVRAFRKRFFPNIPTKTWNDWRWQVANRIRRADQLERMLALSDDERLALNGSGAQLPLGITPYYMALVSADDPMQPIRKTVIPHWQERIQGPGEADDPLAEDAQSPVPGMVHRYPDRVLLLLSDFCSTYCRYCTRSRVVGHGDIHPSRARLERAFAYIAAHREIRDVILSGGDPLLLGEEKLAWVLSSLRQIPHVEIVRIGTKVPAVLPQRITSSLVKMLRRFHPLFMSLHFTHPDECTPETARACGMLADAGIPLGSQTVLLKGVNDSADTMRNLMHALLKMRVRPYYIYQCDPITGSQHFRTPVSTGVAIIERLRGWTSGYAVPTFVVDAPGGGGKVPLMPNYVAGRDHEFLLLTNYEGGCYRYPDTAR